MRSAGSRRHSIACLVSAVGVLAASLALAACGGSSSPASATVASANGPLRGVKPLKTPVSLTLSLSRQQILTLPLWYCTVEVPPVRRAGPHMAACHVFAPTVGREDSPSRALALEGTDDAN